MARLVAVARVALLRQDRRRAIGVAQLDLEVGDEGLEVGRREVRGCAGDVAR